MNAYEITGTGSAAFEIMGPVCSKAKKCKKGFMCLGLHVVEEHEDRR